MAKAARLTWEVHLDAPELHEPGRVGWLYQPLVRTDAPASFEYDTAWLQGRNAFALWTPGSISGAASSIRLSMCPLSVSSWIRPLTAGAAC
jgi:hypothetical protein